MDDRRDDEPRGDEAVFRLARVGRPGSARSILAPLLLTMSLGGLVLAGVFDGPGPAGIEAGDMPAATEMRDVPAGRVIPAPSATAGFGRTGSLLALHTRAWGRYVFVHADIRTIDAEVVIVSIVDWDDDVLDSRSVDMPKGSTALRLGASDRLQLAFEVAGVAAAEVAYVQANVFDDAGRQIASERQPLIPPSDPGWWRSEGDT